MIYELRTYTVKPGTIGDMVKAASTVSRDIRKDDYGKLEGYWLTEIGPLNQVLHMWSYQDFEERARMRAELAKNPRWAGEYVPLIRPEDKPAIWLNKERMEKYRPEMTKYYYDPTKYKTYLEQLGIKYPTTDKPAKPSAQQ